jgi:hypothetical protein
MVTFDWDERFKQLGAFQNEQGHCRVPQSKDTDTYQLTGSVGKATAKTLQAVSARKEIANYTGENPKVEWVWFFVVR